MVGRKWFVMICGADVLEAIEDRQVLEQRAAMEEGGPRRTEGRMKGRSGGMWDRAVLFLRVFDFARHWRRC